jgi:hypothetical protein
MTASDLVQEFLKIARSVKPITKVEDIRTFIMDWSRLVEMDTSNYAAREDFLRHAVHYGEQGIQDVMIQHYLIDTLLCMRTAQPIFPTTNRDFLSKDTSRLRIGTAITAFHLWRTRYKHLYLACGPLGYYRAILNTTPLDDLA